MHRNKTLDIKPRWNRQVRRNNIKYLVRHFVNVIFNEWKFVYLNRVIRIYLKRPCSKVEPDQSNQLKVPTVEICYQILESVF